MGAASRRDVAAQRRPTSFCFAHPLFEHKYLQIFE
jgi:hypothetical protein